MTNDALPEPGPARDRMVAEVVGWKWDRLCQVAYTKDGDAGLSPSLRSADALAALLAWKARVKGTVTIIFDSMPDTTYVRLEDPRGAILADANDDTLPAAATTALLQTKGET